MLNTTLSLLRRPGAWRLSLSTSRADPVAPPTDVTGHRLHCLLWIAIAGYVGFRVAWLNEFMTHVDDILPLTELIRQRLNPFSPSDLIRLSAFYTYPPGQFAVSLPLAWTAADFETALTLFRLPSLIFWLGGLALFWRVLRSLWPETPAIQHTFVILLGLVSWRGFIESSQGYNYGATTLVVATAMALTLTAGGRAWLVRNVGTAFAGGLLLGALTWLTYQALFVCAATLGGYALCALVQRDWRRFWLTIPLGLGFAGPFAAVAWLCLRHVLAYASGVPGWGRGVPGSSLAERLTFPFVGWFDVLQNNLTFVPWGRGSLVIGGIAAVVIVGGLAWVLLRPATRSASLPLVCFLAGIVAVFTAGPYLKKFFLGPTRHTFVLQLPILLAMALALNTTRVPERVWKGTIAVVLALAGWFMPQLLRQTRNHVDYRLIAHYLAANPEARIVDLPGSFTWEFTYLGRRDPRALERMRWNNQFPNATELAAFLGQSSRSFIVSHRAPPSEAMRSALKLAGFRELVPLAEIAPTGSTELIGNINGGNGFYFYELNK